MKIGDKIYVKAEIDEIRKGTIICKNKGGYFGTVESEIVPQLESYKDCISRTDVIKQVNELFDLGDCYCDRYSIVGMLNQCLSVKPARAKGYWVENIINFYCNKCGGNGNKRWKYCPDCGTEMEVDDVY